MYVYVMCTTLYWVVLSVVNEFINVNIVKGWQAIWSIWGEVKNVQKRLWEAFLNPKLDHHTSSSKSNAEDSDDEDSEDEEEDDREKHINWKKRSLWL